MPPNLNQRTLAGTTDAIRLTLVVTPRRNVACSWITGDGIRDEALAGAKRNTDLIECGIARCRHFDDFYPLHLFIIGS
jgi:hypothetical protein